jgi:hypothetical protein
MRTSSEIDAYPANYKEWEALPENEGMEASEEINALFGDQSPFEETHGFFIDGVDATTARLPIGWQSRAAFREIESYDRIVTIIGPCVEDMAVSKLTRLVDKDRDWLTAFHAIRPFDKAVLLARLGETVDQEAIVLNAGAFLAGLSDDLPYSEGQSLAAPEYDPSSHCAFRESGHLVLIRAWDERKSLFHKVDNHLGPAVVSKGSELYFIEGKRMSQFEWSNHPRVAASRELESGSPTL